MSLFRIKGKRVAEAAIYSIASRDEKNRRFVALGEAVSKEVV